MGPQIDMGAEIDWMAFLYNLNTAGGPEPPLPMTDVWKIFRNACVPPPGNTNPPLCSANVAYDVGWESQSPVLASELEVTPPDRARSTRIATCRSFASRLRAAASRRALATPASVGP